MIGTSLRKTGNKHKISSIIQTRLSPLQLIIGYWINFVLIFTHTGRSMWDNVKEFKASQLGFHSNSPNTSFLHLWGWQARFKSDWCQETAQSTTLLFMWAAYDTAKSSSLQRIGCCKFSRMILACINTQSNLKPQVTVLLLFFLLDKQPEMLRVTFFLSFLSLESSMFAVSELTLQLLCH